jgi:hypothetical protein
MLRLLLLLLVLLPTITGAQAKTDINAHHPADRKAPRFRFTEDKHDFGTLTEGDSAYCIFIFKNVGRKTLIITHTTYSCACFNASFGHRDRWGNWHPLIVRPGRKGKIIVTYDTRGKVGPFYKQIWIESNAGPNPGTRSHTLIITGTVLPSRTPRD